MQNLIRINTAAPRQAQSAVMLIYTGGTLGMVYDKESNHLIPFNFENILKKMPELRQFECELTVFSFPKLIDSSNVQPDFWIELAQIICENYENYDGFVVLHGTDTMAYSASALSFLLDGLAKPVIFTGAQLPIGAIRNDARRNLVTSIQIASTKTNGQAIVPEVCIFFNHVLLRGNRSRKVESTHFDAFHSENYPALAKVGIHIDYNTTAISRPPTGQLLKYYNLMSQNVVILKLFPGITKRVLESILAIQDLKGLVLETYGSGNAPTDKWFIDLLAKVVEQDILIYNVSQCIGGKVIQGRYETSKELQEIGVIGGSDITSEAAITKLMFLLGQNLPISTIKSQLNTSLRGEMALNI